MKTAGFTLGALAVILLLGSIPWPFLLALAGAGKAEEALALYAQIMQEAGVPAGLRQRAAQHQHAVAGSQGGCGQPASKLVPGDLKDIAALQRRDNRPAVAGPRCRRRTRGIPAKSSFTCDSREKKRNSP